MPYKLSGWNDFYEGWLANCLLQPLNKEKNISWQRGWQMGEESGDNKVLAIPLEIEYNHILVECVEE